MKTLISLAILAALLIVSCTDTPLAPLKSDNQSYQLIKLPPKAGLHVENEYFDTKTINGDEGGTLKIKESYVATDGHTVKIDVKFKIKKNSFSGEKTITMTVDDGFAVVWFTPHNMIFSKATELDVKFEGINLNALEDINGYDFVYINNYLDVENVNYNQLQVKESQSKISVKKAKLNHFSRYAFIR